MKSNEQIFIILTTLIVNSHILSRWTRKYDREWLTVAAKGEQTKGQTRSNCSICPFYFLPPWDKGRGCPIRISDVTLATKNHGSLESRVESGSRVEGTYVEEEYECDRHRQEPSSNEVNCYCIVEYSGYCVLYLASPSLSTASFLHSILPPSLGLGWKDHGGSHVYCLFLLSCM